MIRPLTFDKLARTVALATVVGCTPATNQLPSPSVTTPARAPQGPAPSRAELLKGDYGRYRANNDLLYYHLDVRVDPDKKYLTPGARPLKILDGGDVVKEILA